ncbi:homeobox-leucine zipper protein HOX32 [Striga asiatica]|uniref:Homeobox-leucine zipper protein HOX32 n=1 Tax=Striga asiatica TaxID=4170 RepID=A0A5A7PV96_STRAF|nr:homeobox-leucine zipper protein HOX32 [Striga asiatica]
MALSMHRESSNSRQQQQMDASKYVRYTPEQVDALERVYAECPKPSSLRRQQLIRECPILSNIEPKQIKVWFQNRRCREKQRKEASRLQTVNRKLTAMNKLLMEENDRLQKQVSQLVYENGYMRQQLHTVSTTTTDTSCDSVVMSGQQQQKNPTPQHPQRDANSPAGLLAIAEETLAEFLGKATGTAVDWVQMIGMKWRSSTSLGFHDAVNGFVDDGWSVMGSDGVEDVTIAINSSPSKFLGSQYNNLSMLPTFGGVLCARASMLLQNVPPALLVRFLREHRSEWADYGVDVYSAASLKASPYAVPCTKPGGFPSSQVILPLAQTVEHEEFLEVVRLEGHAFSPEDIAMSRDMYLLQLCSGIDETNSGACAQLVFAPIDESFGDDAPLLPSGFREIPTTSRTLDLASSLDLGHGGARPPGEPDSTNQNVRSVLTIAFQFTFENHYRDSVAAMARQYVRSIVGSVQRVAMAIAPSPLGSNLVPKPVPGSPEAVILARWICRSYNMHTGAELFQANSPEGDDVLKQLWHHSDAIMCCSVKMNASAVFTFANQAGLDMLETTLVALQDIMLEKILDEAGRKILLSEFSKIMQQGFAYLPAGVCVSSMGRPISYEQAIAWKVLDDEETNHCLAFMFMNWSFV